MMELSLSELQGWFLGLSNKNTGANGNVIGAFPASVDVKNNTTSFWYSEITGYALSLLVNISKQDKNSALSDCKNTADKAFEFLNYVATQSKKIDDIDSIFTDTEIEFFELLELNDGEIPLTKQKNIDVVINYLVKSGIAPKYIEEIIPTDNF